jgi:hypothetical protein
MALPEVLIKICQKANKSEKEIENELNEEYNKLDTTIPEETRKRMSLMRLIASYRKIWSSSSEVFEGMFIGVTASFDFVAGKRKSAIDFYNENPDEAVKRGITDIDGNPLYFAVEQEITKMPEWAKQRIGQKLPETDIQSIAYGFVNMEGSAIPVQLRIRGDNTKVKIPMFTPVKFNGLKLKSSTEKLYRINDSGELKIQETGKKFGDEQIIKMLKEGFKEYFIKLSDIPEYCSKNTEFGRFAIFKVLVTDIVPTKLINQLIRIEDESLDILDQNGEPVPPVAAWVPEHILLNFPIKSEIFIVGQPNVNERGSSVNIYGIYVPAYIKKIVETPKKINPDEEEMKW